jgi:hypothetical protein
MNNDELPPPIGHRDEMGRGNTTGSLGEQRRSEERQRSAALCQILAISLKADTPKPPPNAPPMNEMGIANTTGSLGKQRRIEAIQRSTALCALVAADLKADSQNPPNALPMSGNPTAPDCLSFF